MAIILHAVDPARHDRAVVFAVDGKYARFALFAATQIAALHPVRDFDIVICSMVEDLAAPPTLAHLGIRFCRVTTGDAFDGLRLDPGRTPAVYLRLALPDAFRAEYRRLLYLDADIFVQGGDLSALMGLDLKGFGLGAVRDNIQWRTPGRRPEQFRRLGLPTAKYFNAGMLLIDVEDYLDADIMARCVELGRQHREIMIRHDQNLLNAVLQGGWAELHPTWNWLYTRDTAFFEAMEDANIVHFIGPKKPWNHSGGALPRRFRRAYRDFFAAHLPEAPQIGPDGKAPHDNRSWMRKSLLRHVVSMNRFCDYLDRFENELDVKS